MQTLALYAILCASLFYLGSRALISRSIWSRYPIGFARFMDCPACTGFWWGFSLSCTFSNLHGHVFFVDAQGPSWLFVVFDAIATGLAMIVATPLVAGLMQHALNVVGEVAFEDATSDDTNIEDQQHD